MHFPKDRGQEVVANVHDGIKSRDSRKRSVGEIERHHISFAETNVGVQPVGLFQHSRRKIQTEDGCTGVVQVARDVTGTATHVTHLAAPRDFRGETIEQLSIERLVPEFVGDSAGIFIRQLVVAFSNRLCEVVVHRDCAGLLQPLAIILPRGGRGLTDAEYEWQWKEFCP